MAKAYVILSPGERLNPTGKYRVIKGSEYEKYLKDPSKVVLKFKDYNTYEEAVSKTDGKILKK